MQQHRVWHAGGSNSAYTPAPPNPLQFGGGKSTGFGAIYDDGSRFCFGAFGMSGKKGRVDEKCCELQQSESHAHREQQEVNAPSLECPFVSPPMRFVTSRRRHIFP
jgi:hypothetical protein